MSEGSWEARMSARAREREAVNDAAARAESDRRFNDARDAAIAGRDWLNGWPSIDDGRAVLMGTEVRCVCCGRSRGLTTVAFPDDWEPPGAEPAWPFSQDDCPLCEARRL